MAEQTSIAAVLAQLPRADERNRYFTGKFLTESDFADEQSYFLARHCLHNRLLHGWGIVSGLEVRAVADSGLEVGPGVALDPLGRELILRDPETLSAEDSPKRPFFLVIRYHCEEDERVPPLLGGERPDHTEMQANRYRESVELMAVDPGRLWLRRSMAVSCQWRTENGPDPHQGPGRFRAGSVLGLIFCTCRS